MARNRRVGERKDLEADGEESASRREKEKSMVGQGQSS